MNIVVTTPTGHIGSKVAENLIGTQQKITVIARYPDKVSSLAKRGVRVIQGSHNDADTLDKATRGAKALLFITPPNFVTDDARAYYREFGRAAAGAIKKNDIPFVVHLSSIGADRDEGTGPVLGLHDNEPLLSAVAKNIVHLRPGYFMENILSQIHAIKGSGNIYTTFKGSTKIPMIATRDIAKRISELLTDLEWSGHQVVELQGPGEISYDEVAKVLSEVLHRQINHVQVTGEQFTKSLVSMGISEHVAQLFNDLAASVECGRVAFKEPRNPSNTTETVFPVFAAEVFKPAYDIV